MSEAVCFRRRCFYVAQTFLSIKKWKETMALYERSLEYAREAIESYKKSKMEAVKRDKVRSL